MSVVSLSAEAALDIIARIGKDLRIDGIQLRDIRTGRITHLLRPGPDALQQAAPSSDSPVVSALQAVAGIQTFTAIVSIAQQAAMAATLHRIEAKLHAMEQRLGNIQQRIAGIDAKLDLVLAGLRESPVARVRAARNQALAARKRRDHTALSIAASNAETGARDLIAQAGHLVRVQLDGLPAALRCADALSELVSGAVEATEIASAMHLALGETGIAAGLLEEAASAIAVMQARLHSALTDPELVVRRTALALASTTDLVSLGEAMRRSRHVLRARAGLIEVGLIVPAAADSELEQPSELPGFVFEYVESAAHR